MKRQLKLITVGFRGNWLLAQQRSVPVFTALKVGDLIVYGRDEKYVDRTLN